MNPSWCQKRRPPAYRSTTQPECRPERLLTLGPPVPSDDNEHGTYNTLNEPKKEARGHDPCKVETKSFARVSNSTVLGKLQESCLTRQELNGRPQKHSYCNQLPTMQWESLDEPRPNDSAHHIADVENTGLLGISVAEQYFERELTFQASCSRTPPASKLS